MNKLTCFGRFRKNEGCTRFFSFFTLPSFCKLEKYPMHFLLSNKVKHCSLNLKSRKRVHDGAGDVDENAKHLVCMFFSKGESERGVKRAIIKINDERIV